MDNQVKEKILFLLKKNFDYESFLKNNILEQKKKIKEMSEISIEWKKLNEEKFFYLNLIDFDSENLINEEEEKLAKQEIAEIEKKEFSLIRKIEELLTLKEEENQKESCIIEIRSGAGGNESKLFVSEILQMYLKFSERKKWKVEMMNSKVDNSGGFSFVSFLIRGKDSFKILKNESGVHRVQRIPETENKGRIQTSTVTVVVLQELEDIVVKIDDKDIRIDTYRSSGAGGQHVNTTDSAVRITHIPTGIFTTSQDGRSQIENKKYALTTLKSLVYEKYRKNQENEVGSIRSGAIRNSERSEKIRTYNFQQNRVTDHRVGFQVNKLESFMNGDIDDLCGKLVDFEKKINYNKDSKLKFIDIFIEKMKKNNEKDL